MILTNKAKEDFIDYLWESKFKKEGYKEYEDYIENQKESHTYADIIEWFDSSGIYIDAEFFRKNIKDEPQFVSSTTDEWNGLQPLGVQYNSRQEATKQAIIKANILYNDKKR